MFSGFSGQPIFERWTIGLFNVVGYCGDAVLHSVIQLLTLVSSVQLFTCLGTFTLGFFEQDVSAGIRMSKPRLYKASQEGKYYNSRVS